MGSDRKRYRAFISYSQVDKKWAQELHKALETYRVPLGVIADIDPKKRTIGKVFRDDEEMGASESLGAALEGALVDSEALIVLCSPNSAQSKWVDLEVRRFKQNPEAKVFAVIIAGAPNTGDSKTECFCPSLRFKVNSDGELSEEADEPLAPDWRKDGLSRLTSRLTAGILGVGFDELWQRDRRRKKQQMLKRALAGIAATFVLGAVSIGFVRDQNLERSEQLATAAHQALKDELSSELKADHGSNAERALRLAVLATKESFFQPAAERSPAVLRSAAFNARSRAVLNGHSDTIVKAIYSPDSALLASYGYDSKLLVWDVATGILKLQIGDGRASFDSVDFSPDSKQIVVVRSLKPEIHDIETGLKRRVFDSEDIFVSSAMFIANGKKLLTHNTAAMVQIWDVESERELAKLERRSGSSYINSMELSPDEAYLLIAYSDKKAILWNIATQTGVDVSSPDGEVKSAGFSANGDWLLTGFNNGQVQVFHSKTATQVLQFDADENDQETQPVSSVHFSPDQSAILTSTYDGISRVWEASSGKIKFRLGAKYSSNQARFSPDGRSLVTIGRDQAARLWDARTGDLKATLIGHEQEIKHVAFAKDSQTLFTVGAENTIRIWEANSNLDARHFSQHIEGVAAAKFNADASKIVTAGTKAGRVFDVASGEQIIDMFGHASPLSYADFGVEEHLLVTTSWDGMAGLWDTKAGKVRWLDLMPNAPNEASLPALVEGARFNAQGDRLLTFGDNGTTRLWDVQSADEVASIDQPTAYVTAAEFNADGSLIASASAYGAFIWDGRTGEKIRRLERDDSESKLKANVPAAIAFHPDGNSVVVVDETNELIHWELQEAMPTAVFDMGRDQIKIIRFSPDATFLVTGDDAGAIRIIDLLTGQERAQLLGHPGAITRLNISATGDLITSASLAESNIRVWDVQSGLELARLGGLKSTVSSVEFSLDGSQVIAASYYDPTVRLWDISALRPIATSNGGVNSLLIEDICNPQTGKLRGDLRYLSEGDAAVVPFLKASVGIDVCK